MYLRTIHAEHDLPILYDFVLKNPLGIFTTAIPSPNYPTIQSSHIPWVLDIPTTLTDSSPDSTTPVATLRGHMARANPQAKVLIESLANSAPQASNGVLQDEILILFNGPVHHYVTPQFYTETKPSTGKVVPTWNYSAVQAYGRLKVYHDTKDASTGEFLAQQIADLSRQSEEGIMGYDGTEGKRKAWTVEQAPERYTDLLKKAIIGVEVEVTRLEGKWKMSQESTKGDREGTIAGFKALGTTEGAVIAEVIEQRAEVMEKKKTVVASA